LKELWTILLFIIIDLDIGKLLDRFSYWFNPFCGDGATPSFFGDLKVVSLN
jgi:hypothetical protein